MVSVNYSSLKAIQNDIKKGDLSCISVVRHYLKNIEEKQHLNVFLEVYKDEALAKAEEIDRKFMQAGRAGSGIERPAVL